jgi:hypothetical protein
MNLSDSRNRQHEQRQRVIVTVGETQHDVSILCFPRSAKYKSLPQMRSLYPSTDDLPVIPNATLVFSKAASKFNVATTSAAYSSYRTTNSFSQEAQHYIPTDHCIVPNLAADYGQSEQEDNHDSKRAQVEIAPGYWVALRGSKETWNALQQGFSLQVHCPCCSQDMLVIADAAMALCPECRTVVPISDDGDGLGLGARVFQRPGISKSPLLSRETLDSHQPEEDHPSLSWQLSN